MFVYRVSKQKYSDDLSGEGARLHGGRWNHKMTACIYTSESRALAILEFTVNVNIEVIPRALSITTFEIPNQAIIEINETDLPGNWKEVPAPSNTKDFGTNLLKTANSLVIKIPSIIIPLEFNYLLNPSHADKKQFKIINTQDFLYDVRIKA